VTNRTLGGYTTPQVLFCEDSGLSGNENPSPSQALILIVIPDSGPSLFYTWVNNVNPIYRKMELGEYRQVLFGILDSYNPSGFDIAFSLQDWELD
jgi:hypothetical protein